MKSSQPGKILCRIQSRVRLLQLLPNGNVLGTCFFTFAALDALVCGLQTMTAHQPFLLMLGGGKIVVQVR